MRRGRRSGSRGNPRVRSVTSPSVRRNLQAMALVIIVGAGAGAAIAGRPTTPPNDVRITSVPTSAATTTTTAPATTARPTTTTSASTSTSTSATSTTTSSSTSTTSTTSTSSTTTTEVPPTPDREDVRVVVANATTTLGLASSYATLIEAI